MEKTHFESLASAFDNLLGKKHFERFYNHVKEISTTGAVSKEQMTDWLHSQLNTKFIPENIIQDFRVGYIHWIFGKKHFHIDANLAHMLVQTDAHNVDSSLLRLPFPCVYFTVPTNLVEIKLPEKEFGGLQVSGKAIGAYVYEFENEGKRKFEINMFINLTGANNQRGKGGFGLTIPMNDGVNVFDAVNKELNSNSITSLLTNPAKYPYAGINRIIADRFILLIVNTLLYLQSDKAIMEHVDMLKNNDTKSRKGKKKNSSANPYIRIGKSITINPKQKKMYKEANELKDKVTKQYKSQWIVRGHWRNQAFGEGFKDRKIIWIQPYVKGTGEIENTQYTIK
jgi:hypothetical protein